ncbi:hypothetical protein CRG98_017695 [Punica granatum]|uniref:Malectin-like domain-containing protein n=1 Tax=Punica granatum TaxID=22663 RepID=A0A2I0K085_PUNGR|nr:hypothetical protein CRG98_017695 [Punica granatum]
MATFLVFLLLSLSSFCASAEVSWNIDCGSTVSSYSDSDGMEWVGDSTLIKSGKLKSVASSYSSTSNHVWDTLRVFTSGKKNCYSLKAEKGVKVLLQAFFYYGNYDGKSSPPSFDLELDGNDLLTVETSMELQVSTYIELVYTVQRDYISVCLVQTQPDQLPFISSLRIKSLPSGMYKALDPKYAMINRARYAFGSDETIRYPTDVHGRIWDTIDLPESRYTPVTSEASRIDTSDVADDIPEAVMENAITTSSSSENATLEFSLPDLPTRPSPAYITMYFTEAAQLDSSQKRSFSIYVDGNLLESTKGFSPIYGKATQLSIYNVTVSENTIFTFLPTSNSTLPPLVSAMEVYRIVNYTVPSSDPISENPSSSSSKIKEIESHHSRSNNRRRADDGAKLEQEATMNDFEVSTCVTRDVFI